MITRDAILNAIPPGGIAIKALRRALALPEHLQNVDLDASLLLLRSEGVLTFNPNTGLWKRNT